MTYIPLNAVYLYKILSAIFDYLLAFFCARFVCILKKERSHYLFCLVYSVILLFPTVVINSSVWGQCDSMYTAFIFISLCYLLDKKYKRSFFYLGIAFSLKLQTVFVIPFFLYYYVKQRNFSIFYFFIIPIVDYILYIPSFILGRSLLEPILIYLRQTGEYPKMWLNFPSIWALAGNDQMKMRFISVVLVISILGIGMFYILHKKIKFTTPSIFMSILVWSVWTCLLFLPSMHERYGYMLDLLLVCFAFIEGKIYYQYAVVTCLCSLMTYGNYLFELKVDIRWLSFLYVICYFHYIYYLSNNIKDAE